MPRARVSVRPPTVDDLALVLEMWDELRSRGGRGAPLAPPASEERTRALITDAEAGRGDVRLLIAEYDGTAAGLCCLVRGELCPFVDTPLARIEYLHVRPAFLRRGVAHVLLEAAAQFADGVGADHVSVHVFPQLREANRFYAKIGFTPLVVRRIVSTATLRRRLAPGTEAVAPSTRAGLMARRRSTLRARRASSPA